MANQNPGHETAGGKPDIQGEGNYDAARRFDEEERAFIETGQVEQKAREAADALNGPGADNLEAARVASAKGKTVGK